MLDIFLIALSLSMDAFAVSMCKGLAMRRFNIRYCLIIAAFFGSFQAVMPLLGWLLASSFASYIAEFDHWIAFLLLFIIGGKMLLDSIKEDDETAQQSVLNIKELFVLAVATSIDAMAVGITLVFLNVNILTAAAVIGTVTFALSALGVFIGGRAGARYKNKATFCGGAVLIIMSFKILLEHLGVF